MCASIILVARASPQPSPASEMGKRGGSAAAGGDAPRKRFTQAQANRFANDIQNMTERRAREVQEEEIRRIIADRRSNPQPITGVSAFIAGTCSQSDDFPRCVGTMGIATNGGIYGARDVYIILFSMFVLKLRPGCANKY